MGKINLALGSTGSRVLTILCLGGVKRKSTGPKWSHLGQVTKQGLISNLTAVPTPPKKYSLNWSVRNLLISTRWGNLSYGPLHPAKEDEVTHLREPPTLLQRKRDYAWNNPSFSFANNFLALPSSYKTLPSFCTTPQSSPLVARWNANWFNEPLNKAN